MSRSVISSKSRTDRAARLRAEASNCIAIAVTKAGEQAAALIDEAVRLARRSRELTENLAS
jgi:hypothetical protein